MNILIHPAYFGTIESYIALAQAENVTLEMADNYQKQTYRNRTYITTSTGKLSLNIPIKHASTGTRGTRETVHQKYKDVKTENDFPWRKTHWKSIQNAYRTSPYFEYYEDDLAPIFEKDPVFLLDFNLDIFSVINELLGIDVPVFKTGQYEADTPLLTDLRHLIVVKREPAITFSPYKQVLQEQDDFLPNLSILDLLFNEGPNALTYLESHRL